MAVASFLKNGSSRAEKSPSIYTTNLSTSISHGEAEGLMLGRIERSLADAIHRSGTICLALIDSEGINPRTAASIAKRAQSCGVKAILVGGSTAIDQIELDKVVTQIKKVTSLPVILFPGNVTGVSPHADAILFSSLLNSDNPYFITEAQALGSLAVRKYRLEVLPMGYLVIGDGGTTGFVGRARGIPREKPNLAAMYALAAQYMGMRFLYLEAGSGVTSQVSTDMVSTVRRVYEGVLIVGGGIRTEISASRISRAGADMLVIGSLLESEDFEKQLKSIVMSVTKRKGS